MVEDTPDDYVHDLFNQTIWGDTGLGQSVLGRRETVKSFIRDDLITHIKKYYGIKDVIIACAGNHFLIY
jgi:predicted Zn-dependent peptidase